MAQQQDSCFLSGKKPLPRNRVFLKEEEEPFITVKEIMLAEENETFLSKAVCCKSGCYSTLRRLAKLRRETEELKREVTSKIRSVYEHQSRATTAATTHDSPKTSSQGDCTQGGSHRKHGRRKRLLYDTPTKKALSQPVASLGSPVDYFVPDGKGRVDAVLRSLMSIGRSVGRRNRKSIVCQVMKDRRMCKMAAIRIGKVIKRELKQTCKTKEHSVFKDKSLEALEKFNWSDTVADLQRTAPILTKMLQNCINAVSKDITISVVAGVLLQAYSERACLIQRVFSLLYSCHSPKQLFTRLQKTGLCVSHRSTIRLVDKMGDNFDKDVKEWCRVLTKKILKDNRQPLSSPDTSLADIQPLKSTTVVSVSPSDMTDAAEATDVIDDMSDVSSPDFSPATSSISSELPETDTTESDDNIASSSSQIKLPTFKVVGDNVDKSVRPREETSESHLQFLHYFHSYAVLDRCDMSSFSDNPSLCNTDEVDVSVILPSDDDCTSLRGNVTILMSRVLRKHFTFFQENVGTVTRHIPHLYSKEMSQKSTVVPLGVLDKNENKNEDMKSILAHLEQYVPVQSDSDIVSDPATDMKMEVFIDRFHYLLFGGDQLTVERATGTKEHNDNEWRGLDRLQGFLPVVEDWHAKVCLLKAIWKILYKTSSGSNSSTLYQLRNLVKRRSVTVEIKSDPITCEEFFLIVIEAHIISVAMKEFGLTSVDDTPTNIIFSKENFLDQPLTKRNEIFSEAVSQIVDRYALFKIQRPTQLTPKRNQPPTKRSITSWHMLRRFCHLDPYTWSSVMLFVKGMVLEY